MSPRPPAEIGMALEEVDTPALVIELDAFERNLARMADALDGKPVKLRAHSKTHKSPIVGLKQMALGAVGLCCQKVGEAEAMVAGGIPSVLISNQIVGASKLRRLAALSKQAWVGVCADDAGNVEDIDRAAAEFDTTIDVLVEIDVGAGRCGVEPGEPALDLAKKIESCSNLRFGGLQAYHGRSQHIRDYAERKAVTEAAVELTRQTVALLKAHELECDIVGGAGTGSFQFEAEGGVHNELQAGSYVFMDADYGRNLNQDGGFFDEFENSLFVYATVMSKPTDDRCSVDAGLKAVATDSGMPVVEGMAEVEYLRAADEHGLLDLGKTNQKIELGDKLKLIPGHCDPTVNLYDWYVCVRNGKVEALWPVAARGAMY